MICRECDNHYEGTTDGDKKMLKQGYKLCRLARNENEVERATYIRGDTKCMWPDRLKNKQ